MRGMTEQNTFWSRWRAKEHRITCEGRRLTPRGLFLGGHLWPTCAARQSSRTAEPAWLSCLQAVDNGASG